LNEDSFSPNPLPFEINPMPATKRKPVPDHSHIAESLRPLAAACADLVLDPANARKHPEDNLEAIKGSLAVYGQRKPIVVNRRTGAVEAGNGTLEAARAMGWTHVAAVYVDDDPMTAAGFSIADNRQVSSQPGIRRPWISSCRR
jgi:hypothetical protein